MNNIIDIVRPVIVPGRLPGWSGKPLTLGARSSAPLSTVTVSRKAYPGVAGAISITLGTGEYRINGGTWVSGAGTLVATDCIEARLTSSGSYETALELVFSIGAGSDTFTVTTMIEPNVFPYTFPFELE